MTMLPAGRIDLTDRAAPLHQMVGDRWPEDLWICAVRRTDGARVVFGRPGSPPAPLAAAVLASCAIPAYFAPVTIGGVEYFDGGVHSATNADVLRNRPLDLVVVVAADVDRPPAHRGAGRAAAVGGPPSTRARGSAAGAGRHRGGPDRARALLPGRHGPAANGRSTARTGWPRPPTGKRPAWCRKGASSDRLRARPPDRPDRS